MFNQFCHVRHVYIAAYVQMLINKNTPSCIFKFHLTLLQINLHDSFNLQTEAQEIWGETHKGLFNSFSFTENTVKDDAHRINEAIGA